MKHKLKPTQQNKKHLKHNRRIGMQLKLASLQNKLYTLTGTVLYYSLSPFRYISKLTKEEKNRYWLLHMDKLKLKMFNEIQNGIEYDLYHQAELFVNNDLAYNVTAEILDDTDSEKTKCDFHIGWTIYESKLYSGQSRRNKKFKYTNLYNDLEGKYLSQAQLNIVAEECLDHVYRYFKYINDDTFVEEKADQIIDRNYNRINEKYIAIKFK